MCWTANRGASSARRSCPGRYIRAAMELIHTCYRIGEIDRSVAFYEALGFEERRRMPIREGAINVFMGLPGDGDRLELTYNHGVDSYEMGAGYNHIAVTVSDLDSTLAALAEQATDPEKPPYHVRDGGSRICLDRDPDAYRIEQTEKGAQLRPSPRRVARKTHLYEAFSSPPR